MLIKANYIYLPVLSILHMTSRWRYSTCKPITCGTCVQLCMHRRRPSRDADRACSCVCEAIEMAGGAWGRSCSHYLRHASSSCSRLRGAQDKVCSLLTSKGCISLLTSTTQSTATQLALLEHPICCLTPTASALESIEHERPLQLLWIRKGTLQATVELSIASDVATTERILEQLSSWVICKCSSHLKDATAQSDFCV